MNETDAEGTQITSREAALTVRGELPAGDNSNLPLCLIIALAALGLMGLLRRWTIEQIEQYDCCEGQTR